MKKKTVKKVAAIFGIFVTSLAAVNRASALEGYSPYQPGVSTSYDTGALPPPGGYFFIDSFLASGNFKDGSGNDTGVKYQGANISPILLYVTPWKVLGASYAVKLVQPFQQNNLTIPNGPKAVDNGLFNTVIFPEILSWNLGKGNFVSQGFGMYLPDGAYRGNSAGEFPTSYANNYMTFEPNFAYSYLANGWDITLNNILNFNTTNQADHYHSGSVYYLDGTIAHHFGQFTLGIVGNYTLQFTDDTHNGVPVSAIPGVRGTGNRWMHAMVGPMASWNLGKATVSVRYMQAVAGRNGADPSFFHLAVIFPFS